MRTSGMLIRSLFYLAGVTVLLVAYYGGYLRGVGAVLLGTLMVFMLVANLFGYHPMRLHHGSRKATDT